MNVSTTPAFISTAETEKAGPPPQQFHDLPTKYCHAWADRDPAHLLSMFSEDSVMTDHGAQIHVPKPFLERHHRHWNGAHDNFEVHVE